MPIKLAQTNNGKVLEFQATGKLAHGDCQACVDEFERLRSQHGKLRVLFDMVDFHGWEVPALWDEIKFDVKHFSDIERLAMVGDKAWEKWMTEVGKPFTTVRYFDHNQIEAARAWLIGG